MRVELFKLALSVAAVVAFGMLALAVERVRDRRWKRPDGAAFGWIALILLGVMVISGILAWATMARARDLDGRYAQSPLKGWFDQLKSRLGPCCSHADGVAVADADWESNGGHYRVRLGTAWMDVPDDAVITKPNLDGRTMVWSARRSHGDARDFLGDPPAYGPEDWYIRCFMPGPMT